MLRVVINERPSECQEGMTILDALRATDVRVPTLCHDNRLKPYGGCRLCLVQVAGWDRPAIACTTALTDGMEIETHTPDIEALRRSLLKLIANKYPEEAYRRDPGKEFHAYIRQYRLEDELCGHWDPTLIDDSHPYIRVDMSQCVYCFRCVRICDEVQGQFVWRGWNRGDQTRIRPDGPSLLESSCVSCGACVDTCPSGALEDRSRLELGVATDWVRTTCPYCGTGCEMSVGTRDGRIVAVRPVADAPVSKGHLCVKGRYAFGFVAAVDRVTEPMVRRDGVWKTTSWDEAIGVVADGFRGLLDRYGPRSIGVLGSARATNEENYLAQKFARVVLGTNNVDCCARVCHAPSATALKTMLGAGAATNCFDDIERARTILVCGANPTENHPIVGARIKQTVLAGARLIVIDPRRIELAEYADCHLAPRPGTDIPLLSAMAHTIVKEALADEEFLATRVDGLEEYFQSIERWTPEQASVETGVDVGLIREAARLYASEKPSMSVHGLGLTEHVQGSETVMALVNLALLTGNIGEPGTGVNPLRGQNNVQGAAQMGCEPALLTGSTPLAAGRDVFEQIWGAPLPDAVGLPLLEMMDAALDGKFKGLWAIGYDVLLTNPNATETRRALAALELLVVQDIFLNETARAFAHVFLPACSSFEKDGTFMNAERRIQRVRKALDPIGHSRPDWEIICAVAGAMGKGGAFEFDTPESIWDEVRTVWKGAQGISYARIEGDGLRWPCPSEDHPGTDILHRDRFHVGPRARLRPLDYTPTRETTSPEFPFLLTTGRTLYQFNAGTMTGRTPNAILRPRDLLEMAPADAVRLSFHDGDRVRLVSRYGRAVLPLHVTGRIKPGELFATFHTPDVFLNFVTGPHRDRFAGTPEYKVTAVKVEKMGS
ncbi:MAG TPA: formate dehydrogenase subunit alpha [Kiloniellales bacterium]